jgi:hypothetical protein
MEETLDFARTLSTDPPGLLLSAGGDGTAVGLVNTIRDIAPERLPGGGGAVDPVLLGVLPLGTGNAWARVTGAKNWRHAIDRLGDAVLRDPATLPRKRFDLVEVFGKVAHFAGTGWDAEFIDDFHAQKEAVSVLPKSRRNGLAGYLNGMVLYTIPRGLFRKPIEVELYNTGEDALTVDENGRPVPLRGGEHGKLLYRGPTSVCAAGTTPEWGFGFKAFPFAGTVPGRFNMRIYGGNSAEATLRMRALWLGKHPVPKMNSWLLSRCRAVFSEKVPFQVGGDRHGHMSEVEYALAPQKIDLLDWRRLKTLS